MAVPTIDWGKLLEGAFVVLSGAGGLAGFWAYRTKKTEIQSSDKNSEAERIQHAQEKLRDDWSKEVHELRDKYESNRKEYLEGILAINNKLDAERETRHGVERQRDGLQRDNVDLTARLLEMKEALDNLKTEMAQQGAEMKAEAAKCAEELKLRDGLITTMRLRTNDLTNQVRLLTLFAAGKVPAFDMAPIEGLLQTAADAAMKELQGVTATEVHVAEPGSGPIAIPEGAVLIPRWKEGEQPSSEVTAHLKDAEDHTKDKEKKK